VRVCDLPYIHKVRRARRSTEQQKNQDTPDLMMPDPAIYGAACSEPAATAMFNVSLCLVHESTPPRILAEVSLDTQAAKR